ncbi:glycosyltransferase family 4 protein [Candidatus Woesearchaeota archaeon]|nr:glycosyltransferase family 4 protein [Candidatus Woesearchaeota archaeon]
MMKYLVMYAYPPEPDGLSLQGHMLYEGLLKNGREAMPCNWREDSDKILSYSVFKPDVAIGVGYWGYIPKLVLHPQKHNIQPVPWFVADGWVANYHDILNSLPLVLTTSDWVTSTYARDGVNTKNFRTAHIGIDTNIFRPLSGGHVKLESYKEILGLNDHEKVILTVGGDVSSKGAQEMFRALAKVDREFQDWKYVCKAWGDSESYGYHHKEELRLVQELGIQDKVVFVTSQMPSELMPFLLNICDIYAAPSRLEGYGMIQVEAQSCGKPVISINAMGPKETIVHGETGFLANVAETVDLVQEKVYPSMGFEKEGMVKFDRPKTFGYRANTDELAEHTLKLLSDDELREQMGQNAREHAVRNFDYVHTSRKIAEMVEEKFK